MYYRKSAIFSTIFAPYCIVQKCAKKGSNWIDHLQLYLTKNCKNFDTNICTLILFLVWTKSLMNVGLYFFIILRKILIFFYQRHMYLSFEYLLHNWCYESHQKVRKKVKMSHCVTLDMRPFIIYCTLIIAMILTNEKYANWDTWY